MNEGPWAGVDVGESLRRAIVETAGPPGQASRLCSKRTAGFREQTLVSLINPKSTPICVSISLAEGA